ncbi:MAG TPA: signal peptidase I [Verrucomicrobiae bacterium]|nr:signal peptidase I [Verrucomicrobiae bacterium]
MSASSPTAGTRRLVAGSTARCRDLASGAIRLVAALVLLVGLGVAWRVAMPVPLGGSSFYAVVSGISMLPRYHTGDLVVVTAQAHYRVGEVAAYNDPQLKLVVLHRIIARHGDRFVFKGDNNGFVDSYQPTQAQIVGAEALHLAGVGLLVEYLRTPIVAALILGFLWILAFAPARVSRRQRRRHRRHV